MKYLFNKIYIILIFILALHSNIFSANNDKVKDIDIEGLKNFKASAVNDVINIKKNKIVTQADIDADIRDILATGKFLNVDVNIKDYKNGVQVIYLVTEKPMINSIRFEGNKQVKKGKLLSKIELQKRDPFDEFSIRNAEKLMTDFYKEEGYANAKIDTIFDLDDETNKMDIIFYISEGKQIKIKNVIIENNKKIKRRKILRAFGLKAKKVYKEDEYKQGLEKIIRLYKEQGFLGVKIDDEKELDANQENIIIKLKLTEGVKYKIGQISIIGNSVFSQTELLQEATIATNKFFKQSEFEESLTEIQAKYAERGYIQANITPEITYLEDKVDIKIKIIENNIIYIDRIYIAGNNVTKDYVIRREFIIKEQEPFNVKKVQRSQERIFNLGFFRDVQIDVDPVDENTVDLVFKVEEQPTGMATIGAGYSSEYGLIGNLQFTKKNLFGRGQQISFLWEFGKTKQNYQISFREPYFFGTYTSFDADIFDMTRQRDYVYKSDTNTTLTDTYTEEHVGGTIRFGRRFLDDYRASIAYGFDRVRIYDVEEDRTDANHKDLRDEAKKGIQDTSSITLAVSRDTRDNVFYTSRGSYSTLSTKIAGTKALGGTHNFVKNTATYSKFFPLFWRFVLAFNVESACVNNFYPSENVPIYEKFFIGGSESVRGYDYRGDIGPDDGAKYKLVYNIEYKFPLFSDKKNPILQGAFFFDVGGAWETGSDITLEMGREEHQMKAGYGFGLRFTTPAFPIRLDWGYGIHKPDSEKKQQFYFTIGQLF